MAWNDGLDAGTPAYNLASSTAPIIRAVAGPGSGKSFAIKRRVARLLESGVQPHEILAVTFTRTAAQDVKKEIFSLGIEGVEDVHSRTLHSHALKILMDGEVLALTGRNTRMVIDHEIEPILHDINKKQYLGLRNKKKLVQEYTAAWASLQSDNPGFVKEPIQHEFEIDFVKELVDHNGLLVGEVIPEVVKFLRNNPASPHAQGIYKAILVDEYQDLNRSEQEFIRLIKGNANLVIVGDDDQSIYSFKYAHPEGIREIRNVHGEFENIEFNQCRRCPKIVTTMASDLISNNSGRTLGALVPFADNQDGIVQTLQWETYDEEKAGLVRIIQTEINSGRLQPQDILILSPRRRLGYELRDSLLFARLNVKSYFRESAIDKDHVQRAYSLLNFISNPDDSLSLRFLLGCDSPDFRRLQYQNLKAFADRHSLTIKQTLEDIIEGKFSEKGFKSILVEYEEVKADVEAIKNAIFTNPVSAFANHFINTLDDKVDFYELNEVYIKSIEEVSEELRNNQEKFSEWFPKAFRSIQERIALPEVPEDIDHIRIMSLHASKGLSAKFVILSSMIDNLMPSLKPELTAQEREVAIEEARRLYYVAITRCKSSDTYPGRLIISSFLSIPGRTALRLGIRASASGPLRVLSSRFQNELGKTAPHPVLGHTVE